MQGVQLDDGRPLAGPGQQRVRAGQQLGSGAGVDVVDREIAACGQGSCRVVDLRGLPPRPGVGQVPDTGRVLGGEEVADDLTGQRRPGEDLRGGSWCQLPARRDAGAGEVRQLAVG